LQTLKHRLQNILSELNISISELQGYNEEEIKKWISSSISTSEELDLIYNKSKILDFLKDLDHIFKTGKNVLELILLEITDEIKVKPTFLPIDVKKIKDLLNVME